MGNLVYETMVVGESPSPELLYGIQVLHIKGACRMRQAG